MRLGLQLPQGVGIDLSTDVTSVARRAEEIGYGSLWAYERVLFALEPADGMYGVPGLPWDPYYRSCADPLTVLTLAAAVTDRVDLGTCVLVAPLHGELSLARTVATLDQASRGRVVLGLGSGWSTDEYRAAASDFAARGQTMDEIVDALRALWSADPVTFANSRMSVDNALVSPKPHRPVPIVFGGGGPRALERVALKGDGWIPVGLVGKDLASAWSAVKDSAAKHGRDPESLRLLPLATVQFTDAPLGADRMPFQGTTAQVLEDLASTADAGAHETILTLERTTRDASELVDRAAELFEAVRAAGLMA